ncbi:2956_t:CDS:1, partial [Racocetra persica]
LDYNDPQIVIQVFLDLKKYLFQNGKSLLDFPKLPSPDLTFLHQSTLHATNQFFNEETIYNQDHINTQLQKI